ncbi:MAG TPA: GYD domain-containing protein [Acidobacteriaceae bacterium]
MPSYLIQLSYKPEIVAGFIKKPADRSPYISKLAQKIGGTLVGSWFSFGEYDAVLIIDGSDNVSAAACSMAVSASGAFKAFKTTPLLSVEEGMAAMKKAGSLGYKPPNGKK